ncbi:IAA-alanine resistance protein 1-like [Salvia splendens]|uniref:IAA-alanine resistance protein 1-like n=1 Tax=Salvia splendens TaxID=180675 RepID=UPI001C275632|nr:IAA-alanine resistance protein 1-like [Salvia splendens]
MGPVSVSRRQIYCCMLGVLAVAGFRLSAAAAHQCSHHHHHVPDDDHVGLIEKNQGRQSLLPEEIAEEEDLKMMWGHDDDHHYCGHGHHEHDSDVELVGLGLWINAMGCSLLVSLASLICLIMLPFIFIQGKPSKAFVDSLALFGAGAMVGDAFLHQLPHAFGGEQAHSHDHHDNHHHEHSGQSHSHSHSHSLKDLSVGLSILAGIVVFLIVEKVVRYVEEYSGGENDWNTGHHHHHHHHKHSDKLKDDDHVDENHQAQSHDEKSSEGKELDKPAKKARSGKTSEKDSLRKRTTGTNATEDTLAEKVPNGNLDSAEKKAPIKSQSSLVFGYLNLFSDGVHNFTDGMALGSAFLLYGSVGGWSRTLFLLAHELPQEIGDFGILVRSGFTVSKALFFNFLSALVALAGTALALIWGKDPGQSSLIEGFTAGGFIYIALAGVLAEMNNGTSALRNTAIQLVSLLMGMAIALCISLVE